VPPVELKFQIPDALKNYLLDDYDLINNQNKLLKLPSNVTVKNLLKSFTECRLREFKGEKEAQKRYKKTQN
jgi:hypothetical protein